MTSTIGFSRRRLAISGRMHRQTMPLPLQIITIEASHGITTGVSAVDRVQTVSPGHVFPLVARPAGVLDREGHTEAAVDLARLAGLAPAGVLCELMNPDGSMARGEQVARFAREHGLRCPTVEAIAGWRRRHRR